MSGTNSSPSLLAGVQAITAALTGTAAESPASSAPVLVDMAADRGVSGHSEEAGSPTEESADRRPTMEEDRADNMPGLGEPPLDDDSDLADEDEDDFTAPGLETDLDEEEGTRTSDRSSVWDSDEEDDGNTASPLQKYIYLGATHCRAPMAKAKDAETGIFHPGVCGCNLGKCKYKSHKAMRLGGQKRGHGVVLPFGQQPPRLPRAPRHAGLFHGGISAPSRFSRRTI